MPNKPAPSAVVQGMVEGVLEVKPAAKGPALLVVEAFAGSYTIGRHFADNTKKEGQADGYHLAAYAAIELEPKFHAKAAGAKELGLDSSSYLNINGSVSDFGAQSQLLHFVTSKLQDSAAPIGGVVVFGGPPCTAYTSASRRQAKEKLDSLERDYQAALLEHAKQDRLLLSASGKAAQAAAQAARDKAAATAGRIAPALEDAASEAAVKAHSVLSSDSLVKSFLTLYKTIEAECKERQVPCWLLMENPYSTTERGLWNRPFMREHLTRLPNWPTAKALPFKATRQGWLRPVCQNWCTYGPKYPLKPTIIVTNLPEGALPDRFCKDACMCEGSKHATTVANQRGAHARATWPVEFVGVALQACVMAAAPAAAEPAGIAAPAPACLAAVAAEDSKL